MSNYHFDFRFKGIVMEESFVISILELQDRLEFKMELVLTPEHRLYDRPKVGESYCYVDAFLIFSGNLKVKWSRRSFFKFKDASGTFDMGNIDNFNITPKNSYYLEGDWGAVNITCMDARIIYNPN